MKATKYLSSNLICGIDGGGTVTKIVVTDLNGNIILFFQAESINHYGTEIEQTQKSFIAISDRLLEELRCLPGIIYIGNSALSGLADDDQVQDLTNGVFQKSKVIFHSDVYIALLGFTMGKTGAVLISGTGSMACGLDAEGKYHTAGGWGQTLGDEGSGYFIGLEGMKAAIRAYEGMMPPTLLTDKLIHYFKLKNLPEVIDKIYNPPIEKKVIATFAIEVHSAALAKDIAAIKILEEAANWLYNLALVITNKCKTKNLGYYGSVINQNEIVRAKLSQQLEMQEITMVNPKFKPEIGAVFGAFQEKGMFITDEVIENLLKYNP